MGSGGACRGRFEWAGGWGPSDGRLSGGLAAVAGMLAQMRGLWSRAARLPPMWGLVCAHFAHAHHTVLPTSPSGAKLDLTDNNQNTALHYAAGYGQAESVRLLVVK